MLAKRPSFTVTPHSSEEAFVEENARGENNSSAGPPKNNSSNNFQVGNSQ